MVGMVNLLNEWSERYCARARLNLTKPKVGHPTVNSKAGHHQRMVRMVTIIHLPEAPKVGPQTLHQPRTCTIESFDPFRLGGVKNRILGENQLSVDRVDRWW